MRTYSRLSIGTVLSIVSIGVINALPQEFTSVRPDVSVRIQLVGDQQKTLSFEAAADQFCDISTDAKDDMPLQMSVIDPTGETLIKEVAAADGVVFVAPSSGQYKLLLKMNFAESDTARAFAKNLITVSYTNKLDLPKGAETKSVKVINSYQAKIVNEPGDDGKTYFLIQKSGRIKAVMRSAKEITGGFYFSDDPDQLDGANAKASAALMRTVADKTGDGTPDVAVEYYTGGAHCCFEITFFELGANVRQLSTIDTANDRMTAIAKKPGGGLRFQFAEQAFAYWNINFAQSPMPTVVYEFDKSDRLVPRFDLMKKPAPTLTKLKRDAAAMKAKINLNPYTSPEDNFNDWEEPFWADMLDLIYTGHEDLAWQYFDLVWPAKKQGKEKFRTDFKEQLALATYGEWKKTR